MKKRIFILLTALVMLLTACSNGSQVNEKKEDKLTIVTSFFPPYDMARKLAGDKAIIYNLTEKGDAHSFEPSIGDMEKIYDADLFVVNGANFEGWVNKVKESKKDLQVISLSDGLELIKSEEGHDHDHDHDAEAAHDHDHDHKDESVAEKADAHDHDHKDESVAEKADAHDHDHKDESVAEKADAYDHDHDHKDESVAEKADAHDHDHDHKDESVAEKADAHDHDHDHEDGHDHGHNHGGIDPHTWVSPKNYKAMFTRLKDELIKADEKNKDFYQANYDKYIVEIDKLIADFDSQLAQYKGKAIVTPHEAFSYMLNEYGIKQVAIEGINSVAEPNAARMKEIVDQMNKENLKTIFYEYGQSDKAAKAIANEIGGNVKEISTLERIGQEDMDKGNDYIALMRMNLKNIVDSFKGN